MTDIQIIAPSAALSVAGSIGHLVTVTIRERIISGFVADLAEITLANGYHSNSGDKVFRCRKNLAPQDLPCIVIWPGMETSERREYGNEYCAMKIGVEAHALFGSETPSIVSERLLGDLIRAVFSRASILPADAVLYESGGTDSYPDAGDVAVGCKINLVVKYNYLIGNPYSQ